MRSDTLHNTSYVYLKPDVWNTGESRSAIIEGGKATSVLSKLGRTSLGGSVQFSDWRFLLEEVTLLVAALKFTEKRFSGRSCLWIYWP